MASRVQVGLAGIGLADPQNPSAELLVGHSGGGNNASVTLCSPDRVLGICEQERITRIRAAGINSSTGLPDEALDELLRRSGQRRHDVARYEHPHDRHFGHACTAFLPSSFESAVIVVCDHEQPQVSVWEAHQCSITQVEWPWSGVGFAEFYSQCATALGFSAAGKEQRMEALARLKPSRHDDRVQQLVGLEADGLRVAPEWQRQVEIWVGAAPQDRSALAAALQHRVGSLLLEFLSRVRRRIPGTNQLCVGGSLFYNSYLNSQVKQCGGFDDVFVPINPGSAGLSLGAALPATSRPRQTISPFLGPSYSDEEIKATLDNCKLTYDCVSEADRIGIGVEALQKGRLVAWFDDAMEWGPRALGARSIVANPFAPYVLDNLNRFLKRREAWRGYALSGLLPEVREQFIGPAESPYMECDFVPRDRERFRHVLPGPDAAVRVHTVDSQTPPRFVALLQAFGEASGLPVLVNTSFNGFQEPIVCSPRDAIRVFFGTGIDVLLMGRFVLKK